MIDPKELRIGNLVLLYNDECAITEIGYKESHLESEHFVTTAIFDIVDPIPITPEWLERMGIYWDIYWQGRTDGNWVITEGNEHGNWRIAYGKRRNDIIMWNLKYVHQLQNLYFALTGTELTIHPE